MKIAGINKTTLLDYPGQVAATVFTAGCNFCCPFCHNGNLVNPPADLPVSLLSEEEVFLFLEKRKKILTGICVTGGEPTLQPELKEFLHKIKSMGYCIKLDTNGYRPDVIKELLEDHLLDYIAMDIKNSKRKYAMTAGFPDMDVERIMESVDLIKGLDIDYEFRTTVVKELHAEEDLVETGEWLAGGRHWFLQAFEENDQVIQKGFHAYPAEKMKYFAEKLTGRGILTLTRGII